MMKPRGARPQELVEKSTNTSTNNNTSTPQELLASRTEQTGPSSWRALWQRAKECGRGASSGVIADAFVRLLTSILDTSINRSYSIHIPNSLIVYSTQLWSSPWAQVLVVMTRMPGVSLNNFLRALLL